MSKTTESKTFKQLKAVMKDVNGDNRQIIKTNQDQIDYLMEFIDIFDEILEEKPDNANRNFQLSKRNAWRTGAENSMNFCWDRLKRLSLRQQS